MRATSVAKDLPRLSTKPPTVDRYDVFTGCQWRFLPSDFPKWQNVYAYWRKWSQADQDGNWVVAIYELMIASVSIRIY